MMTPSFPFAPSLLWLPASVLLLGLAGCDQAARPAPSAASAASSALPAASAAASPSSASASAAAATLVKGIYTWGPEVETFSPCHTDKTYWLEGSEAALAPLQALAVKKADAANEAYQPIYVELHASPADKPTDGFAVYYDGMLHLHGVVASSADIPGSCPLLEGAQETAPPANSK